MRCFGFGDARFEMAIPCLDGYDHRLGMVNELLTEVADGGPRLTWLYV
jgi:hypothetical protein